MRELFETMVNFGPGPFFKRLDAFLKTKGKDIEHYTDKNTRRLSDMDTIYVYSDITEVDGFKEFIEACNLVDTGRDSDYPLVRDAIILSPKNNNTIWDIKSGKLVNFGECFKHSKLYHLARSSIRNKIIINGLRPKSKRFVSERDGSETYDGRIYLIVKDMVDYINENQEENIAFIDVIDSLKYQLCEKRHNFEEYDIWEVTLPSGVELHKDPKYPAGGFVTCKIPPTFIKLIDEKTLRREIE